MIWERPLVEKQAVLAAYDLTGHAGESAFKRLRSAGAISSGLLIRPRRAGHIAGTVTALCSLNLDAAIAYRKGRTDDARRIASWATRIEASRPARRFVEIASEEPTQGGFEPTLAGVMEYVYWTDDASLQGLSARIDGLREGKLHGSLGRAGIYWVSGIVSQVGQEVAEITSPRGGVYVLPLSDLAQLGLDELRAPVFVRRVDMGAGRSFTFIERGCRSDSRQPPDQRPFGDLLPAFPEDLGARVDRMVRGVRPIGLTGPVLPRTP